MFKLKIALYALFVFASPTCAMMRSLCSLPTQRLATIAPRLTPKMSNLLRFARDARSPFLMSKMVYTKPTPQITPIFKAPFSRNSQQNKQNNNHKKFDFKRARNFACLAGTGAALTTLYQTAKAEAKKEEPKPEPYKNPYEAQRKKYYDELLAKPWGEVSKKYIDALEAEEKELMKEFFELAGMNEEQLEARKAEVFAYLKEHKKEIQENALKKCIQDKDLIEDRVNERITHLLDKYGLNNFKIVVDPKVSDLAVDFVANLFICGSRYIKSNKIWNESDSGYWKIDLSSVDCGILHEIQHVYHNDIFMNIVLSNSTIKDTHAFINEQNEFSLKFRRFQEKRADILAGLNDISTARGGMEGYKVDLIEVISSKFVDVSSVLLPIVLLTAQFTNNAVSFDNLLLGITPYITLSSYFSLTHQRTHPNILQRMRYFTQLHQEMLEAMEKNKQKAQ
jgi:hypothetical protein